ncbi:MAG: DUF5915 domain-containing protein, partial [Patescibacteria group bacterium]
EKAAGELVKPVFTPNARMLGPKYGAQVQEIIMTAKRGEFELLDNGKIQIGKVLLNADEGTLGFVGKEGMDVASDNGIVVALDTRITTELKAEGFVREIIRNIQELRKDAGYEVSDRIYLLVRTTDKELQEAVTIFSESITRETLAVELQDSGSFEGEKEETMDLEGKEVLIAVRKA